MARRINGEGTVYKHERTGRWIGAVTLDGRRKKVVANTGRRHPAACSC